MELDIKTVSFGGYDKKAVEAYIEGQQEDYEKQITKLKEDTAKLSEAVKGLQQMREVNKTETDSVIDNLKNVNEKLEIELERMKVELEDYKKRDSEAATRYESISRTLLAARESADELTRRTTEDCEARTAETTAQCQQMIEETTAQCDSLKVST